MDKNHSLQTTGHNVNLEWVPAHVDIKGNEMADKAAKAALTQAITRDVGLGTHEIDSLI
jgi:ribonuclease HI